MARKFVVGGAGFIGSHLVEELYSEGYDTAAVDLKEKPAFLPSEVGYRLMDIGEIEGVELLEDVDTVFIQSGKTGLSGSVESPGKYYRSNCASLIPLIEAIENTGVEQVIAASSVSVYGQGRYWCGECDETVFPGQRHPTHKEEDVWNPVCGCGNEITPKSTREGDPKNPLEPYSRSKLAAEMLLRRRLDNTALTVLRYPFVYGPRQKNFLRKALELAREGKPIEVNEDGLQQRDFLYVKDIARLNLKVMEEDIQGTYNTGTGETHALRQFLETLIEKSGGETDIEATGNYREFDIRHSKPDITKIGDKIDFDFRGPVEGLERTSKHL